MAKDKIESRMLPEYPRTRHLCYKPNAVRDDLIATQEQCSVVFSEPNIFWEEKIDGSSCGMALLNGHPIIRNRNHLLHKSFQARTAAKMQFSSIWGWFYQNIDCFQRLEELAGPVSVYGEWMFAVHGIQYDNLPSLFVTYDLYDYEVGSFITPAKGRACLAEAGFQVVPLLHHGKVSNWEEVESLIAIPSAYTSEPKEGVYVKVANEKYITHRFKLVREGFIQGEHWSKKSIKKNVVQR